MQTSNSFRPWKRLLIAAIGIQFLAFFSPHKDDLVELSGWLNGRSDSKFRSVDLNHTFVVKPGTRARITDTKFFPQSKNYGVCLEILNSTDLASDQKCTWIYYNVKNPNMTLFSVADKAVQKAQIIEQWAKDGKKVQLMSPVLSPAKAQIAQTVRPAVGVVEHRTPATPTTAAISPTAQPEAATPARESVDAQAALRTSVANIDRQNRVGNQAMTSAACTSPECLARVESYETCSAKNDYLENGIAQVFNTPALSALFSSPQKEIIRKACIQRSLDTYPNFRAAFRVCQSPDGSPNQFAPKACVSRNYVDLTAKSFNLVADCLSDYVSGNANTKKETALALFSLTSLESGLHANAVSPTGAGGIGQLTYPAITDVNSRLKLVREHLAQSKNPLCSKTLADVLSQPMNPNLGKSCERISLSKNNPMLNIAYTFTFQASQRKYLEQTILKNARFAGVISQDLPESERERLTSSIMIWSHNTGASGMSTPLSVLMGQYLQAKKSIKTAADVDALLSDLKTAMVKYPAADNKKKQRLAETSRFFSAVQERVSKITKEPRSCLAD